MHLPLSNMHHALPLFAALLFSLSIDPLVSGLSIDLIHRNSPLSPFYESSKTQSELLRNAALRSLSRSKRLHLHTDVAPADDGDYVMRIYIGTPPLETWAIADTGSDVVWLQCLPCTQCFPQNPPLFNPKRSSTYRTVSCHSKPCTFLPKNHSSCGMSKRCVYFYDYEDSSTTRGELARDFVSFGGHSGHLIHHKSVFGCGHNNSGIFSRAEAGIVGLGNAPLSLVSQLGHKIGHKFSYCLVPPSSNSTSKLKLGEETIISGSKRVVSTTFITIPGTPYYILNLEGFTVGKKTTKIAQSGHGNIVIDSGTTYTYLPSSLYYRVEALVKDAIGVKAIQNPPDGFILCFKKESIRYSKINNLNFVVHFKGAKLSLTHQNIFVPQDHLLCFAIFPTDDTPVYGNMAQVNFEVKYHLKRKKLSFAPADCTKK